jgi:hypothetical protein
LSRILLKLGVRGIWMKQGPISAVVRENGEAVRREGNLIFPSVRISIPRNLVRNDEMCADTTTEEDPARRVALYVDAEKEIKKGRYSPLCQQLALFAQQQSSADNQAKLIHLAGICEYEEGNSAKAADYWEQVLARTSDESLLYRANYNLALIECQTDRPQQGYERLRAIPTQLWQSQNGYDARSFLDLAAFCAERSQGTKAKMEMLLTVANATGFDDLKKYAKEKVRGDIASSTQCEATSFVPEAWLAAFGDGEIGDVWKKACQPPSVNASFGVVLSPVYLSYRPGAAQYGWAGVGTEIQSRIELSSGWFGTASAGGLVQSFVSTGTSSSLRQLQMDFAFGKGFTISPGWELQFGLEFAYLSFLTSDRALGFYDLTLYNAQTRLVSRDEKLEQRAAFFLSGGFANSDSSVLETGNVSIALGAEWSPRFSKPFFAGLDARAGSFVFAGQNTNLLRGGFRLGARW